VAIETLNILEDEKLIERAGRMGDRLTDGLKRLQAKHPKRILDVRGRGMFQAIRLDFGHDVASALVDVSRNSIFQTYQTVLIGALTRELFERHDILVHFQPGARDILHVMPPFVVQEAQIDKFVSALDDVLTRGVADATVRFIVKNIRRVLLRGS